MLENTVAAALVKKDLRSLASAEDLKDRNIVVLDEDQNPEWDTIAELWEWAQEGATLPSRAMSPATALAIRRKVCPVSGAPILKNGRSSEYPQLDFSGVKRRQLKEIAHGCRVAKARGKTQGEIVDLLERHLSSPSAEFKGYMGAPLSEVHVSLPPHVSASVINAQTAKETRLPSRSVALSTWKKKLEFLLEQDALIADHTRRFELQYQIQEARAKIQELS